MQCFGKRDLKRHFQNFGSDNTVFNIEDTERYYSDPSYQQYLGFFSDNNSCLKRIIWEKIPNKMWILRKIKFWARDILEAGYKKVYCPYAAVYHSHNYPLKTYFQRYYDEFKGIYNVYQWKMFDKRSQIIRQAVAMDKQDIKYILDKKNNIVKKRIGYIMLSEETIIDVKAHI